MKILILLFSLIQAPAFASLHQTKKEAKENTNRFKLEFGAYDPVIEVNEEGKVIWECWMGPPNFLSYKKSMEMVKQLIPTEAFTDKPKAGQVDGSSHPFHFKKGVKVNLIGPILDKIISVEVCAKESECFKC